MPPSPARLLVVCTANICRSPLAAALLEELVEYHAPSGARPLEVSSAGTHARPDLPAVEPMRTIAVEWGLDLSGHRSRTVTRDLAIGADLVVTMEDGHRDRVAGLAPGLAVRTFTIRELADLIVHAAGADAPELVVDAGMTGLARSLHHVRVVRGQPAPDFADPIGGPREGYRRAARDLADLAGVIGSPLLSALSAEP